MLDYCSPAPPRCQNYPQQQQQQQQCPTKLLNVHSSLGAVGNISFPDLSQRLVVDDTVSYYIPVKEQQEQKQEQKQEYFNTNLKVISSFGATESTASSECASDCCDKDDCSVTCEDEACSEICSDDCPFDVCSIDSCDETKCPEKGCQEVLCSVSAVCHDVVCQDEDCPESDSCPEVAQCAGNDCEDVYCEQDTCVENECETQKCHISTMPGCHADSSTAVSCCPSYHTDRTNPNPFPELNYQYPVGSSLLGLQNQFQFGLSSSSNSHGELFEGYHGNYNTQCDDELYANPYTKRRRISSPTSTPITDHGLSMTPSSSAPTPFSEPYSEAAHNFFCQWNDNCDMSFLNNTALTQHINEDHILGQLMPVCHWEGCGQRSQNHEGLMSHVKDIHTHEIPQICLWEGCSAEFQTEKELSTHIGQHLQCAEQCQWNSCGLSTHSALELESHLQNDHSLYQAPLAMPSSAPDIIGQAFSPPAQKICQWLKKDSSGEFHICGRAFDNASGLQQHAKDAHLAKMMRLNNGYVCLWSGCSREDKPFSQKGKLERHLQTHTGFKSSTCTYCRKEFSAPQALAQHIRIHTGDKPFNCEQCGKSFAQRSALTMHKRVHTGERPLQCHFPGCGKRFSESSNLSKHRKTHNPVGAHVCSFPGCDRSFHRNDQMRRHTRTHGVVVSSTGLEEAS